MRRQKRIRCCRTVCFFALTLLCLSADAQVIKGAITDEASRYPIENAVVTLAGYENAIARTDNKGDFKLTGIPPGRHTLVIVAPRYDVKYIRDILLTNGKELNLAISLVEAYHRLKEIVITAKGRAAAGSAMLTASKIDFRPEDARKFAGSFGDPSRMLANFAGVSGASDTRNDIIVRGNSPNGILWRMEGLDILNPNHYGEITNTGGPVSLINSNNLANSTFYTGAFPAQYGNALSGVFDLSLRNGNTDKTEMTAEIGFSGLEMGIEGPLSSKRKASYIFNYRYSTLGIMKRLGLDFGTGSAIPYYQDLNFKIYLPLTERTKLSLWGMGGPSRINFLGNETDTTNQNAFYFDNLRSNYFTGMSGISVETNLSTKVFGSFRLGIGYGAERSAEDSVSVVSAEAFRAMETARNTIRGTASYDISYKRSARDQVALGINASLTGFTLLHKQFRANGREESTLFDQQNSSLLTKGYIQWKHKFSDLLSANTGMHFQYLNFNNTGSIEPRLGLRYKVGTNTTIGLGYGLHTQMQHPLIYFYRTDNLQYTNLKLGFTRSHHLVASVDYGLSDNLFLKGEVFYQAIRNVPVEQISSAFSALNVGGIYPLSLKDHLVNKGTGRNYGIEATLQKHFDDGYYFLINGSLFNSQYRGSDGIERNTPFNSRYAFKLLAGKDLSILGGMLSINLAVTGSGGRYVSPVDMELSRARGYTVYDEETAPFSIRQPAYFRTDIRIGFRKDLKRSAMEYGVDMKNITNHKNIFLERYNRRTDQVVNEYQQAFLVIPYFRWHF